MKFSIKDFMTMSPWELLEHDFKFMDDDEDDGIDCNTENNGIILGYNYFSDNMIRIEELALIKKNIEEEYPNFIEMEMIHPLAAAI